MNCAETKEFPSSLGFSYDNATLTFDGAGNPTVERTLTSITTSTFDPANRLLVQNSSGTRTSYSYDNYGNRTLKQAGAVRTTYAWDDDHRLSQAVLSDGKARKFTYNGDGLRNSRALVAARTTFAWNGQILVGEKDQDGAQRAYTQGPGGFGDLMNRYKSSGPASDYPLYDALGSVIRLTDQSQVVTATGAYDAWGKVLTQADPNLEYVARLGYYYDPELELYYIRQRWYDPKAKQWIGPDPLYIDHVRYHVPAASGNRVRSYQSQNLYQYVKSSPLRFIDPRGLQHTEQTGVKVGAGGSQIAVECSDIASVPKILEFSIGQHCSIVAKCRDRSARWEEYGTRGGKGKQMLPNPKDPTDARKIEESLTGDAELDKTFLDLPNMYPKRWGWERYQLICREEKCECDLYDCMRNAIFTAKLGEYKLFTVLPP